ncbi:uncharacterized protein [Coffea arabica]|uniref:Uncharacterized protein isoform X5 n=1 Tax=Coffea arabica TaxID=13443 RepID=A0ABM4VNB3_COFAR
MKLGRQTRGRRSWLPICPCTVEKESLKIKSENHTGGAGLASLLVEAVECMSFVSKRGIVIEKAGGPDVLKLVELDDPPLGDDEVLIRIAATAVNRIDLQCRLFGSRNSFNGGLYIPGLECSGIIIAVGQGVTEWKVGDKVCALLNGAGYAEQVAVSAKMVLPVPSNVPLTHAASLPEAAHNAWKVISEAQLVRGRKLLLHECCGYVGLFVLQMAKCKGAVVYVTAETDEKLDFYKRHGADICINCKNEDLVTRVMEETRQKVGRGTSVRCVGNLFFFFFCRHRGVRINPYGARLIPCGPGPVLQPGPNTLSARRNPAERRLELVTSRFTGEKHCHWTIHAGAWEINFSQFDVVGTFQI